MKIKGKEIQLAGPDVTWGQRLLVRYRHHAAAARSHSVSDRSGLF
jgi:hypothetical protein